ncbi:tail fiber assembly protein [Pseudomonas sp. R32]|uniref:tail fiber assembly protein n=1 Tax=Pseudomonas sp. R32 TaxID=1573704 RepID=UPI00132F33F7|nr:tail fiber assembly protein [Pseudomonas sp. R32]QHF27394.1 phage tail protein [Pseudomonas sp. R32]
MTRAAVNIQGSTGEVINVTSLGKADISCQRVGPGEYQVLGTLGMVPAPEGWGYVLNPVDAGVEVVIRHVAPLLIVQVSRADKAVDLQHRIDLHVAVEPLPAEVLKAPEPTALEKVQGEMLRLRDGADKAIAPLQDAVDIDEASTVEVEQLKAWKRYRVALNRMPDQDGFPEQPDWPTAPS